MILRNVGFMTVVNVMKGLITLIVSFYIGKVVDPSQFGLIAFAIPLAALITIITDLGISNAIVREPNLTKEQSGSAFVYMFIFGLVGGVIIALSASFLEKWVNFYGLEPILLGFSLVAAFQVWATVPRGLIERDLRYNVICIAEISAIFFSTLVFFVLLELGKGIYALLFFHIVLQGVRALVFISISLPLVHFGFSFRKIVPLVKTGGWIFITVLCSYAARNFDRFIIGSYIGASAVGFYSFAYQFMTVPLVLIAWPASGVLMASLSRLSNDYDAKKKLVRSFILLTTICVAPISCLFAVGIDYPLTHFLSPKWNGISLYISILAPLGALQALAVYGTSVFVANGQFKLSFILSILNGVLIPLGFIVASPFGLIYAIWAYIILGGLIYSLTIYYLCVFSDIDLSEFIALIFPGLMASFVASLLGFAYPNMLQNQLYEWLVRVAIYCMGLTFTIYLFRNLLLKHLATLRDIKMQKSQ